eukprot:1303781-Amphidinium_carterae.1
MSSWGDVAAAPGSHGCNEGSSLVVAAEPDLWGNVGTHIEETHGRQLEPSPKVLFEAGEEPTAKRRRGRPKKVPVAQPSVLNEVGKGLAPSADPSASAASGSGVAVRESRGKKHVEIKPCWSDLQVVSDRVPPTSLGHMRSYPCSSAFSHWLAALDDCSELDQEILDIGNHYLAEAYHQSSRVVKQETLHVSNQVLVSKLQRIASAFITHQSL